MALTVRHLKDLTATLASDLAARGVAAVRLASLRPGGEENTGRDAHAWLRFYGRLCALRETVDREPTAEGTAATAAADATILAALAGSPVRVELVGDAPAIELAAYPKSAFALLKCHSRNLMIARLLAYANRLSQSDDPTAAELVERALTEALHQHRVLAWIACTPGPGLPFDELEQDPALPDAFRDLASHNLVAACRAFDEVNWARLRALEALLAPDDDDAETPRRRPSWSQFFGSLVAEEGRASEQVLRDRALVGIMATSQLAASAQRDAAAAAKEKSRRPGEDD